MLVYAKLILTAILWGGTFIAGRVVAKDVGPFSAAFFRFFIAGSTKKANHPGFSFGHDRRILIQRVLF